MDTTFKCECRVCIQAHEYFRIIDQLPHSDRDWMEEFYSEHCNEMLQANVNEAIIEGTWPSADDQIKYARERVARRQTSADSNV